MRARHGCYREWKWSLTIRKQLPVKGHSDLELEMSSIQVVFEAPLCLHCGPIQTPIGARHQTERRFQCQCIPGRFMYICDGN